MTLKSLRNQKERICSKAEIIVLKQIQRYCRRYKRTVKTVYGITVLDKQGNEIMDESLPEKWIRDFEDNFGPFGFYMCEKGKWIKGQTPLIMFDKPKLKPVTH